LEEGKTGPVWGIDTSGRGENISKGFQRVNIVQILCTYACKWKNETCGNYCWTGEVQKKENDGGG
jgi:hypothetical protein